MAKPGYVPPKPRFVIRDGRVLNFVPERLRQAREIKRFTPREMARFADVPLFRYKAIEAGQVKPERPWLDLWGTPTGFLATWFITPYTDEDRANSEAIRQSLERHATSYICDVCEAKTGEIERAVARCDACHQDLCDIHFTRYTVDVPLPHGGTKTLAAATYCDSCYRKLVSAPKAATTREATRAAIDERRRMRQSPLPYTVLPSDGSRKSRQSRKTIVPHRQEPHA